MTRPSLLFYCQHSVGMGHLMRSLALVRALSARANVTLVVGGHMPSIAAIDGVRVVAMPPVGLDENGALVSRDRRRRLDRALHTRRDILLHTYRRVRPQAVVIELFPFGRHKFTSELEPMLLEARGERAAPLVCCSLRDILVNRAEKQAQHDARTARMLQAYFDAVLVHSDPAFARLEESVGPDVRLPVPVQYTGFVHQPTRPDARRQIRSGSIVVSAGGGLVGESLLRAALDAQALVPPATRRPMVLVAGPFLPEAAWRRLRRRAERVPDATVRRSVANLAGELCHAAASISQCGYNTAMDLIASGVPALVIPFGDARENEQLTRARRLEAIGALRVLTQPELNPERLASEIVLLRSFRPVAGTLSLHGAERTADIIESLLDARVYRCSAERKSA